MLSNSWNKQHPLHDFLFGNKVLSIAARQSSLSKIQSLGFMAKFKAWYPKLSYRLITVQSLGDKRKDLPLSKVSTEDFFTREVDHLLETGSCDIAIHSAKDMPLIPAKDIHIVAVTTGEDPRDLLVCKQKGLPAKCRIGCSSIRRQQDVRSLYPQAIFQEIRGTIEERLQLLNTSSLDAIVIAKVALQRLNLYPEYTIELPSHHLLQGKLAITTKNHPYFWKQVLTPFHDNSAAVAEYLHIFDERLYEEQYELPTRRFL